MKERINKIIDKYIKTSKDKSKLRNKIYNNLLSLGYSNEMILRNINNYDFDTYIQYTLYYFVNNTYIC